MDLASLMGGSLNASLNSLDNESVVNESTLTPEQELLRIKKLAKRLNLDSASYSLDVNKVINGLIYGDSEKKLFTTNSNLLRAIASRYFVGFSRDKKRLRSERDYTLNQIKKLSQCNKKDNYSLELIGGTVKRVYLLDWIKLTLQARLESINNLLRISTIQTVSYYNGESAHSILITRLMGLSNGNKYPSNLKKADKKINHIRVKSKPRLCLNKKKTSEGMATIILKPKKKLIFDSDYNLTDKKHDKFKKDNIKIIKIKTPFYKTTSLVPMFPDTAKEREKITQPIKDKK